jgi:uncharacterized protein (DUF433 family)
MSEWIPAQATDELRLTVVALRESRRERIGRALVDFPVARGHYLIMKLLDRITFEPGKCGGRPCIRGLRIRVTDILGMLAEGVSHEEILRDFPYLEPEDIKAALAYAAKQADHAVL